MTTTRIAPLLWLVVAFVAMMSVTILNGRPLFYYDTRGYIDQGTTGLNQLGLIAKPSGEPAPVVHPQGEAGGVAAPVKSDNTVDGSRSAVYALIAATFAHLQALWTVPFVNALLVLLAVWLPIRVAHRIYAPAYSVPALMALPLIAASAGSLPFYVAFLMPDIFTPILILMIAALTVFGREMTAGRGYIALAALIFAKWRPWYCLMACTLFGLLDAVAIRFQSIDVGAFIIPVQFTQALPYILTVIILAGFIGKAIPPRAGGEPYVKER